MLNGVLKQTPLVSRWFQGGFQAQATHAARHSLSRQLRLRSLWTRSPVPVPAKQLLQDLCRMKLQWDDPVPSQLKVLWEKWLADLPKLSQFSVSRCIKPFGFNVISSSQLQHFSDASEVGFDQSPIFVLSTTKATFIAPSFAQSHE